MKKNFFFLVFGLLLASFSSQSATITSNAVSGNFNAGTSWVGGLIPSANDSVVIVSGAHISLTANATIYKLKINTGGTLSLNTYTLTLQGNGTSGGNMDIFGTLNSNSGTLQLTGNFTQSGTFNYGTGTVRFNGNGAQSMLGTAPIFYNLRSSNTNGTPGNGLTLHESNTTIKGNLIADGILNRNSQSFPTSTLTFDGLTTLSGIYSFYLNHVVINSGATVNAGTKSIYLYGNWTCNGTFVGGTGTISVQYDNYSSCQPNNQTIFVSNPSLNPFWNLIVNKTSGKVSPISGTGNANGDIFTQNNFTLNKGNWDVNGTRILSVGKDVIYGINGTFTASTGKVILNGTSSTALQSINFGASTLYDLQINNTGKGIQLDSNLTVSHQLTLTDGVVYTRENSENYEIFVSNSTASAITAYSSGSYVAGQLKRAVAVADYTFPVGTSNTTNQTYRPISMNIGNTNGAAWVKINLDSLSHNGTFYANYWAKISTSAGVPSGSLTFSYNLSQDFEAGMYECMVSALQGTDPPALAWNLVLSTTTAASGGNNGTLTVSWPTSLTQSAFVLGEPVPYGSTQTICDGASATLQVEHPTGFGNFYWYSDAGGSNMIQTGNSYSTPVLFDTTTYYIAYANAQCHGHLNAHQINVNDIPGSDFIVTPPQCAGESAQVEYNAPLVSNSVYTWNFDGSSAISGVGVGPHTVSGTAGQTYQISLQVDANGCSSNTTTESLFFPTPLVLNLDSTQASCGQSNGSASVNATGGLSPYTYVWSDGQTTQTALNLNGGNYLVTVSDALGCEAQGQIQVVSPGTLSLTVSQDSVTCFGGSDGSVDVQITGGTSPYQIEWNTNPTQTTATATGLPAGNYVVIVTDAQSCTASSQIDVLHPAAFVINATTDSTNCFGTTDGEIHTQISGGTAPLTITWNNGFHTGDLSNLISGSYTISLTDAHACAFDSTIVVYQPDSMSFVLTQDSVTCNSGSDGQLHVSVAGGTAPYSYQWNTVPVQNQATASNLIAGNYELTVTDANGCPKTEQSTVYQPDLLHLSFNVQDVTCYGGSDGQIAATASGGTLAYSFEWSNGTQTAANPNIASGQYQLTLTDGNGCSKTDSVQVQQAPIITSQTFFYADVCAANPNSYAWVEANGGTGDLNFEWNTTPTQTNDTATGLSAGNYQVSITDQNNCQQVAYVSIPNLFGQAQAQIQQQQNVSCYAAQDGVLEVVLNNSYTPFTYQWSHDANLHQATADSLSPGTYSVTITDNRNCFDTISLQITQPTALEVSILIQNDSICQGQNNGAALASGSGGTSPYTLYWYRQDGSSNHFLGLGFDAYQSFQSGEYYIKSIDQNGCVDSSLFSIQQAPAITLNDTVYYENHYGEIAVNAFGSEGPYIYTWSNGATATSIGHLKTGAYLLTVTDALGCTLNSSYTIELDLIIPTVITPNNDGKNEIFRIINIEAYSSVEISIFNRWGDLLYQYKGEGNNYPGQEWDGTYQGASVGFGSYIYVVKINSSPEPVEKSGVISVIR